MENNFKTVNDVMKFLLEGGLAQELPFETESIEGGLFIPAEELSIIPAVKSFSEHFVSIGFDMYSKKLDKHMTESCIGMGDTPRDAVQQAVFSFGQGFCSAFKRFSDMSEPEEITSEYAGNKHIWDVYTGDISAIGDKQYGLFWKTVKEDIIKRLGDKDTVCVKIFAAKTADGKTVGECRIDGVAIPEISTKISELVKGWHGVKYAAQKQFFFIRQHPETVAGDGYRGEYGKKKVKAAAEEFLKLFGAVDSQEAFNRLVDDTEAKTGDRVLAIELFNFIPEICALHVFEDELTAGDMLEIQTSDGLVLSVYSSQLTDFDLIAEVIPELMNEKILGKKTSEVMQGLVGCSSVCAMMEEVKKQDKDIKGLVLPKIIIRAEDGFVLR